MKSLNDYYSTAIANLPCYATLEEFDVSAIKMTAVVAGHENRKTILLLHGFPECWYSWRNQIPELVKLGYRVIVPDLRGYGLTSKPASVAAYHITELMEDVKQLIEKLGEDSVSILAHDWGGAVAWSFAMEYQNLIEKLIILNAPHPVPLSRELRNKNSEQYKMSWYMRFFQKERWPEKLFTKDTRQTAQWVFIDKWGYKTDVYEPFDLDLYAALYSVPNGMASMMNWYRATYQSPNKQVPKLKKIETDTLVIWGKQDAVLHPSLLEGLDEWITNLQIEMINEAGHFVQNEASRKVNKMIEEFLK